MESSATVLIADDDPNLRKTARILLETNGYRVIEAENGEVALRRMREDSPDVALVDVVMPGSCGHDVLAGVGEDWESAPPIIMMTGYASIDTVVELMRKGACDCLAKPFEESDLLEKIERALGATTPENESEGSASGLSRREIDVLLHMREGLTNKQIADRMGVGLRTVDEYVRRMCRKLGVNNRTGAVAWSYRHPILDLETPATIP